MGRKGSFDENGSASANGQFTQLPETDVKPGRVTKRAEEVFQREYIGLRVLARDLIKRGEYNNSGHATILRVDNEEVLSRQVVSGIQSKINSAWHGLEIDEKIGVGSPEERRVKRYALTMLSKMNNKYYNSMYGKNKDDLWK